MTGGEQKNLHHQLSNGHILDSKNQEEEHNKREKKSFQCKIR